MSFHFFFILLILFLYFCLSFAEIYFKKIAEKSEMKKKLEEFRSNRIYKTIEKFLEQTNTLTDITAVV